jgi:hypothetical protein
MSFPKGCEKAHRPQFYTPSRLRLISPAELSELGIDTNPVLVVSPVPRTPSKTSPTASPEPITRLHPSRPKTAPKAKTSGAASLRRCCEVAGAMRRAGLRVVFILRNRLHRPLPTPPCNQPAASEDQSGQASTGDGAGCRNDVYCETLIRRATASPRPSIGAGCQAEAGKGGVLVDRGVRQGCIRRIV